MKAQILTATLFTAFSGVLSAADPMLLNLVMPDAKVVAGVNVEQAKGTQFGQFVLDQMQTADSDLQKLVTLTGFDPRRDVRELLVASTGVQGKTGLALARGYFDVSKITAAAMLHGVVAESYSGINILYEPKKREAGLAFLDGTTVVAGDIANVKGAIDRLKMAQPLPAAVAVKINQWSTSQDAWGITTVPPASLVPPMKDTQPNPIVNAAQNVQSAAGGVKFGANVVFTGEAVCDTAQNTNTMADVFRLLVNLAQMQAGQDATAQQLIKSVSITTNGTTVKVVASLPQEVFQSMLQPHKQVGMGAGSTRRGNR
ncbi:MAG: hypothetical protein ABI759_20560 [Candidatus Solibacter sp.]